jgi:hypothetical protein
VRKLQRFCASLSLALALSIPTLAGEIQTGATGTPPPPPEPAVFETTEGTSSTAVTMSDVNDATLADPLAELALALLNGVLSIF